MWWRHSTSAHWIGPVIAALSHVPLVAGPALLASGPALLASGPALLASGPALLASKDRPWNRADIPTDFRQRIHFTAAEVPRFPHEDKRLDKPEGWPEEMVIGGVHCVRRIHAWDDDDAVALASLHDAEPDSRLMLFYDHDGSEWNFASAGWGPRYTWDEHGKLMERLWYEPDSSRLVTHDYTYYKSGKLLGYSWRAEPRHQDPGPKAYEFFSEFFDKDGGLLALAYEKMNARSRDSLYAWMGAEVPYDAFRMKTHILYSKAHPGDR